MRSILALLLIAAVPACQTGYGKVFGPATVVAAVVGTTLMATADPKLGEPGLDPDIKLGIELVFASIATATVWMVGEIYAGQPHGAGGGGPFVPPAAVEATPIAAPVFAAPVIEAPPVEPPPVEPPPPVVVVAPADPLSPPGAADNEVYDRAGHYLGRYDTSNGGVWDVHGAWYGNIDLSCSAVCRRSQARALLDPPRKR